MKTLYASGVFDLFHVGHVNLLRHCKKIADVVIVCLNTDEWVKKYKGDYPIIPYEQRKDVLLSCKYVDRVVVNIGDGDAKPSILEVNPDFMVVGDDWARKDIYTQLQITQEWLDEHNITLLYVPYTKGISTTEIKQKLNLKTRK